MSYVTVVKLPEFPQVSCVPTKITDNETLDEFFVDIHLCGSVFGRRQVDFAGTFARGQTVF